MVVWSSWRTKRLPIVDWTSANQDTFGGLKCVYIRVALLQFEYLNQNLITDSVCTPLAILGMSSLIAKNVHQILTRRKWLLCLWSWVHIVKWIRSGLVPRLSHPSLRTRPLKEDLGDRLDWKCIICPEFRRSSNWFMIVFLCMFIGNTNHNLLV